MIFATIIHRLLTENDSDFVEIVSPCGENIKSGHVSFGVSKGQIFVIRSLALRGAGKGWGL